MSQHFLIPDGLKNQDCERGVPRTRPPLSFVPNPVEEEEGSTIKVKINKTLDEKVRQFIGTTPESYVSLMETFHGLLRKKGLKDKYLLSYRQFEDTGTELQVHKESKPVESQYVSESDHESDDDDAPADPEARAAAKAAAKAKRIASQRNEYKKDEAEWKIIKATFIKKMQQQNAKMDEVQSNAFDLFTLLLGEEARERMDAIIVRICDEEYAADDGTLQPKRGKTWDSLAMSQREFLLQVFKKDAAECQRDYLQYVVRKPARMGIRQFIGRLVNMSRQLKYLPTLKDSDVANSKMSAMNKAFTGFELCGMILRACKQEWVDQYYLTNETVPVVVDKLLPKLEAIEQAETTRRRHEKKNDAKNEGGSSKKRSSRSGKNGRGSGNNGYQNDKKQRSNNNHNGGGKSSKYCKHCKKNGGAFKTHDSADCFRFDANGQPKKGNYPNKNANLHSQDENNAFLTMQKQLTKMEKAIKKSKGKSKKRKRYYRSDSDSSGSDSE